MSFDRNLRITKCACRRMPGPGACSCPGSDDAIYEYKTQKGLKRKYRKYFRNHAEISVLDDSLENWTPCYLFAISEKGDTVKHRSPNCKRPDRVRGEFLK